MYMVVCRVVGVGICMYVYVYGIMQGPLTKVVHMINKNGAYPVKIASIASIASIAM